ncbi:MAG TPA: serine/threonine-protein kinase [Polyangiaceae bacterium]
MKPPPPETVPALPFDDDSRVELDGERYEQRELLGRGGMGEVHACFDKVVGREVAMKTILPAAREAGLARFVREAKVQARLEHPAIVPVYDIGTREDGTVWFTMKRVRGRSLEDVLEALASGDGATRAEYTRRKLLTAFVAVCYAVAFAHERGVVHRDLKPANIMLGTFGEVSVLDWGIAKITGSADAGATAPLAELASGARPTEQGVVVGTPGYMSPEQARADRDAATPASDVYALGAILFEILAEKPLHLGATSAEVIATTLAGVEARPSARGADVPPELDAMCVAATALEAAERTASARELARAVERYLDGDRDLERRRVLAAEHTSHAREVLGDAKRPTAAARASALLELGRAVALDASNGAARDLMARLIMTVPDDVPPEARSELDAERTRTRRDAARAGSLRYLWWSSFAMLVFWLGIRSWAPTIFILTFMGASSAYAFVMTRRASAGYGSMIALLVASSIAVALISGLFGPFIIVPTLAATNAMYFAMTMESRHRPWAIVAAILAIAVPFALEAAGVVPPAHDFGSSLESFRVIAQTAYFPAVPTQVVLLLTATATAIIPVVMVGRLRDALTRAEERLFLQAWQLRATLPADVSAMTKF